MESGSSPRAAAPSGRLWCHDCSASRAVRDDATGDPSCPACGSAFVELLDPPPRPAPAPTSVGRVFVDLLGGPSGAADEDEVMRATRQIIENLATGPTAMTGFDAVNASGDLDASGGWHVRVERGLPPGAWDAVVEEMERARGLFDDFGGGEFPDVNLAELDTRTFHRPADPAAVAAMPTVIIGEGPERGDASSSSSGSGSTTNPSPAEPRRVACPVCLADMPRGAEAKEMPCGHRFHGECIAEWLRTKDSCPVCRAVLEPTTTTREAAEGGPPAPGPSASEDPGTRDEGPFGDEVEARGGARPSGGASGGRRAAVDLGFVASAALLALAALSAERIVERVATRARRG